MLVQNKNSHMQVELIAEPLREVEVVGCDAGDDGKRCADMMQSFGALLMKAHPFINLEQVERVVVALNYPLALERYRARAEAFAADFTGVADTTDGFSFVTESGVIVVVGPNAFLGTLKETQGTVAASSRIVVHELCHGHDLGRMRPWLWRAATNRNGTSVGEASLYWLCQTLWAEYFANRYSYFCAPSLAGEWVRLELLLAYLPSMGPVQAARNIVLTFGYVMGSLAAEGARLEGLRPDLVQGLRACGLWAAWFEACTVTERLAQTGECWELESGVLQLTTAVRLVVNTCRYGRR